MNFWMMISLFSRGWKFGAGYLGHFGIAVMALGMLVSGGLGKNERVRIKEGTSVDVLGHKVSYAGLKPGPMGSSEMQLTVAGKNWTFDARPRLLAAPRGEGMIHTPAISMWREIYVSPLELQEIPAEMPGGSPHGGAMGAGGGMDPADHDASLTWLEKQQQVTAGDTQVRFDGFRMASEAHTRVYADLTITRGGKVSKAAPYIEAGPEGSTSVPVEVAGFGTIALSHIDADRGRVALHLPAAGTAGAAPGVSPAPQAPPAERFAVIELSTKPLINLVWIGALLMLVGTALAGLRRATYEIPGAAISGSAQAGVA
jgi:cytochrome c-type biogenesis protein CcmF